MNNNWVKYGILFVLIVLTQGLVVDNIQLNVYFNPMLYPIMIMMLPFELNILLTMVVAFVLGISVDAFSNTFGLNASAAVFIGYLRPFILKIMRPRDGYDPSLLPSIHDMGKLWFIAYAAIILFLHHFWFFILEDFHFDRIFHILLKTVASLSLSLLLVLIFQYIFYKPSKK